MRRKGKGMIGQLALGVWKVEELQEHGFHEKAVADIQQEMLGARLHGCDREKHGSKQFLGQNRQGLLMGCRSRD